MKCRGKFSKLFAVLIIGLVAFNFSISGINETLNPKSAHFIPTCESLRDTRSLLDLRDCISANEGQTSEPLVYLFRILFILFIISPPLIVLMLILIWKELRDRNKLK